MLGLVAFSACVPLENSGFNEENCGAVMDIKSVMSDDVGLSGCYGIM